MFNMFVIHFISQHVLMVMLKDLLSYTKLKTKYHNFNTILSEELVQKEFRNTHLS